MVLAAWIFAGLIVLFGAFCYAELGALFPQAGGPYAYLNRGLGPLWGFLFGWMSSFLERPVAMAALAAGFLRFLSFLFPVLATPLFTVHLRDYAFVFTVAQPLAAALIIAVTAVNCLSVRMSGAIQILMASVKVVAIVLIVAGGLLFAAKAPASSVAHSAFPAGLGRVGALLTALVPAMWAFNGFNDLGDVGEEIHDPGRNIPLAILLGLSAVGSLYLLANLAYFHVLPFADVAASQHVASDAVRSFAGARGAAWLTAAMAFSALGALHVVILTGARIPYAMARDGLFFRFAERLHPSFRTPTGSLAFLGSLAALLALSGTYEELYSLFIFAVWIFFALTAVALLRLRIKEPQLARPYRTWGYPLTPLIFLVAAVALTLNLWMVRPVRSSVGLAVILSGIPFFYRFGRKTATSRAGS